MITFTDFFTIVDKLLESTTMVYTVTNEAVLIEDPEVTLFMIAFGFVVLEFFLVVLNSLRGQGINGQLQESSYTRRTGKFRR